MEAALLLYIQDASAQKYDQCISCSILNINFNRKLNLMCEERTDAQTDETLYPLPNFIGRGGNKSAKLFLICFYFLLYFYFIFSDTMEDRNH